MKGSRLIGVFLIAAAVALAASAAVLFRHNEDLLDLRMRYNESLCAHAGVNPFRVWNGEVETGRFRGLSRPDIPTDTDKSKLTVHSYPPWHVAYTWLYGYASFPYVAGAVFLLYGISLSALFTFLKRFSREQEKWFYWGWVALALVPHSVSCMAAGNYGILCAGLLLALMRLLEHDRQVLAGACWALMMSKPQMAALLVFPLMFQKKYVTIVVAAAICLAATLLPAAVYGESPVELIFQTLKLGAPYETNGMWARLAAPDQVFVLKGLWMLVCIACCGVLSWRWKDAQEPVFRYAPVALIFPIWMYSQAHDRVAAWPMAVLTALVLPRLSKGRYAFAVLAYIALFAFRNVYAGVWRILCDLNVDMPQFFEKVYSALNYPVALLYLVFGMVVLHVGRKYQALGR